MTSKQRSLYKVVPVEIGDRRIDFASLLKIPTGIGSQPRRLFKSFGLLWALEVKENKFFLVKNSPHIQRIIGDFGFYHCNDFGSTGQRVELLVAYISLGTLVPDQIKDVILYHELREVYWISLGKRSQKEAHCRARYEEGIYINKFLTAEEKTIYTRFIEEIKSDVWDAKQVSDEEIKSGKFGDVSIL